MHNWMKKVGFCRSLVVSSIVLVQACGLSSFSDRKENPIIRDYVSDGLFGQEMLTAGLSTNASYRTAYIVPRLNQSVDIDTSSSTSAKVFFCPEPPPDVAQAIAAEFAGSLRAAVTPPAGSGDSVDVGASVASTFNSSVLPLLKKTQGLQYFRDRMFYLCVAYINGIINAENYKEALTSGVTDSTALIYFELKNPSPTIFVPITVEKDADLDAVLAKLKEVIEAQSSNAEDSASEGNLADE